MKKIAVLYYSRGGNTRKMAEHVAAGIGSVKGVEPALIDLLDFPVEKALEYDGLIVGSPTYYGSMSWEVKKFFDDSVKFHGKLYGKVGGAFSSSANVGGGNETTVMDILKAMLIHGMIVQGTDKGDHYGTVSIGVPDGRVEKQCHELGMRVAELVLKLV